MNTCTNCGRPAYWACVRVPTCEVCTDLAPATDVVALVSLRDPATGRVYSPGSTVPASAVPTVEPVS